MGKLEFHNVTKKFGDVTAVREISLIVEHGEGLVLVGPSGCGKTTLLRLVAGIEALTAGDLLMDGRRLNDLTPRARNVAMVFQDYALYPHMTVFGNISFPLEARGMRKPDIRARVEKVARTLGLHALLDRRPGALSGGQRQRVAMGRAIVREPAVFLFDEPLSNLDAKLREAMRTEIRGLCKRLDTTALYVTHDQVEAMAMADRVVVMNEGRARQIGTPEEIYQAPANRFVAGFIGSPPMNFLHGRVGKEGDHWQLRAEGGTLHLPGPVGERAGEREIWLGFRPESIRLGPAPPEGLTLKGRVLADELLGRERILLIETALGPVKAVVNPDQAAAGRITLSIPPEALHVFFE